jgi:hypothetical protein
MLHCDIMMENKDFLLSGKAALHANVPSFSILWSGSIPNLRRNASFDSNISIHGDVGFQSCEGALNRTATCVPKLAPEGRGRREAAGEGAIQENWVKLTPMPLTPPRNAGGIACAMTPAWGEGNLEALPFDSAPPARYPRKTAGVKTRCGSKSMFRSI